jgi:hypothetical protein
MDQNNGQTNIIPKNIMGNIKNISQNPIFTMDDIQDGTCIVFVSEIDGKFYVPTTLSIPCVCSDYDDATSKTTEIKLGDNFASQPGRKFVVFDDMNARDLCRHAPFIKGNQYTHVAIVQVVKNKSDYCQSVDYTLFRPYVDGIGNHDVINLGGGITAYQMKRINCVSIKKL